MESRRGKKKGKTKRIEMRKETNGVWREGYGMCNIIKQVGIKRQGRNIIIMESRRGKKKRKTKKREEKDGKGRK